MCRTGRLQPPFQIGFKLLCCETHTHALAQRHLQVAVFLNQARLEGVAKSEAKCRQRYSKRSERDALAVEYCSAEHLDSYIVSYCYGEQHFEKSSISLFLICCSKTIFKLVSHKEKASYKPFSITLVIVNSRDHGSGVHLPLSVYQEPAWVSLRIKAAIEAPPRLSIARRCDAKGYIVVGTR